MNISSDTDLNENTSTLKVSNQPEIVRILDGVNFFLLNVPCAIHTKGRKLNSSTPMLIIYPAGQPIQINGNYLTLSLSEDDFISLLLNPLYLKAPGKSIELSATGQCKELFYQFSNKDSLDNLRSLFHRITLDSSTDFDALDKEMSLLSLLIKLKKLPALREVNLKNVIEESHDIWNIDDLAEHIRNHFDNPLSLDEMASRCALNASYLSRSFKKKTGTTIFSFLNNVRIEKACLLLRNSSMTITEIAFSVGYNNISFFNRMFKRAMSLTPGEYRRKVRF